MTVVGMDYGSGTVGCFHRIFWYYQVVVLDLFCYLVHTIIFWLRLGINFINLIQFHVIENTYLSCKYIHLCSLEIQVSSKDFIHVLLSHETRNLINKNCLGFFATLIITASSLKFFFVTPWSLHIFKRFHCFLARIHFQVSINDLK